MKKISLILITIVALTLWYFLIYHPEIKKGDVWGFYEDNGNPFKKPDSIIWEIDEVKDGWVKIHYLPIEGKPPYYYDNQLFLYKSWTKFK